jgi:hypothetical protein
VCHRLVTRSVVSWCAQDSILLDFACTVLEQRLRDTLRLKMGATYSVTSPSFALAVAMCLKMGATSSVTTPPPPHFLFPR